MEKSAAAKCCYAHSRNRSYKNKSPSTIQEHQEWPWAPGCAVMSQRSGNHWWSPGILPGVKRPRQKKPRRTPLLRSDLSVLKCAKLISGCPPPPLHSQVVAHLPPWWIWFLMYHFHNNVQAKHQLILPPYLKTTSVTSATSCFCGRLQLTLCDYTKFPATPAPRPDLWFVQAYVMFIQTPVHTDCSWTLL